MRKLFQVAGLSIMVVGVVSLSPAIVAAQEISSDIHPHTQASGKSLKYGIVRSTNQNILEIRTLSGDNNSYVMSSGFEVPGEINPGDLVAYDVDRNGSLKQIKQPSISEVFEGKITEIQGDKITLTAPDGSSMTTTVAERTIDKLQLCTGQGISVTQYEGTWATKVCCLPKTIAASPEPLSPVTPPQPQAAVLSPEPPVEVIQPIRGLW